MGNYIEIKFCFNNKKKLMGKSLKGQLWNLRENHCIVLSGLYEVAGT